MHGYRGGVCMDEGVVMDIISGCMHGYREGNGYNIGVHAWILGW